jgi:hypothetical protein
MGQPGVRPGVGELPARASAATRTEEGVVMATTLTYAMRDRHTSPQAHILADFRSSDEIRQLFDRARQERETFLAESATAIIHN